MARKEPEFHVAELPADPQLWISTIELSVPWFSRFKSRFMLVAVSRRVSRQSRLGRQAHLQLLALPHVLYVAFIPWMVVVSQARSRQRLLH